MNELPADERFVSPVGGGRRLFKSKTARAALLAAGGLAAVGFVAMGVIAALNDKGPEQKPADTGSSTIAQMTQAPPVPPVEPPAKAAEPAPPRIVYMPAPTPPPAPPPAVVAETVNYVKFPALAGEGFFEVPPPRTHDDKPAGGAGPGGSAAADAAKTQVAFKPGTLIGGKAGPAIRLTYVLMPQLIPCALDTAMDSTLAGAIACHTTKDVLSPDHVLLMPAGTPVVGTYKNDVRTGQHRLFAFTGNAITREGIPVPLDSSVADGLGRAGIEGDVDNHYMERFGAAILLTVGESAMGVAQAEVSKSGQTSLNLNTGGGVSSVASQILQSQINIPPTITVPPGTVVSIVVDHPIDFSDALKVAAR